MYKKTSTVRGLKVGDLVYHLLHGKLWIGVLLEIIDVHDSEDGKKKHRELGLVKMQPGTKYENFFKNMVTSRNKVTDSMGLVSTNWLFRLEERKE